MGSLIESFDSFIDEMEVFHFLANTVPMFQWMLHNYLAFKYVLFAAAFLLNFHVIMTMANFDALLSAYDEFDTATSQIKLILGLLCLLGYAILAIYFLCSIFPMRRRELNRLVAKRVEDKSEPYDFAPLIVPAGLTAVFFAGCLIHFYAFRFRHTQDGLLSVYGYVAIVIFAPIYAYFLRQVIKFPTGYVDFAYALVMDAFLDSRVVTNLFFIGATLSGLGYNYAFFSLLLLDFLSLSDDARNTVKSVTGPWRPLTSLVVIFLIVLCIYGIFGYALFSPVEYLSAAGSGGNSTDVHCGSMISCLGLVIYGGVRSSDIASVMEPSYPGSVYDFQSRFFYDLLFYITIGALLFNMVTGIIVDKFSELRDDTDSRRKGLESQSFISGLDDEELDELPIEPSDLDEKGQVSLFRKVIQL